MGEMPILGGRRVSRRLPTRDASEVVLETLRDVVWMWYVHQSSCTNSGIFRRKMTRLWNYNLIIPSFFNGISGS